MSVFGFDTKSLAMNRDDLVVDKIGNQTYLWGMRDIYFLPSACWRNRHVVFFDCDSPLVRVFGNTEIETRHF